MMRRFFLRRGRMIQVAQDQKKVENTKPITGHGFEFLESSHLEAEQI